MIKLNDIASATTVNSWIGPQDAAVSAIVFDSRKAVAGTVFVAMKGTKADGHDFLSQVITQGCTAIVTEKTIDSPADVTQLVVPDTGKALGELAHAFYGSPSDELILVGITGTNGKTTCTTLLHRLYTNLGYKVGLLSTVVNLIGDEAVPATHTTPDPVALNALLADMVAQGCSHCFMEVSSHAVSQNRIAGLNFKGGAFTNITHDHLDYHGTFKAYIEAKKGFFDNLAKGTFALTNADDKNGMVMVQNTKATISTYAMKSHADYMVKVLENSFGGLVLTINGTEVWTRLIGDFNAYNLTTVFGITQLLDEDATEVLTVLSRLESVDGRFQFTQSAGSVTAIVDYAHTPDALLNVLKTIENIRTRNEQVITVVGCGGDRDALKRPEMARIACELSDKVILTSDNPRSEDPQAILDEMEKGVEPQHFMKVLTIQDREQAIKTAVALAQPKDIILVAGKGHEKYQEIKGVKHPFDDFQLVETYFTKLNK
ncbi:MAG: UDP-N-acetylmuramoyl-L-alanyl-D-glutamate--2,6-diaminopimelate ligase [Candidatus Fluviicola riflensis]|nr:MAG: UDP-N-acetylmuramoyl-L-alanyl-D-glutamate--2,6-diaminopimelate ligase [Candidatus Fluviicola riflensis]OGS76713.1 MAG: UDP-N-acetylmuramoyl-L-alanyl-D-glutamate--2,6-diaminopimelate ligase [Candidatus Fluviicola riflensis]OGS82932.1 MAG: UDP-N-acetylmuramoyl-L-alanyl-D-glutamate--2,6-diaminopimelate ligase [Fluviicola sp. RIFCSPHIGHO2_01_FULL_43_53]OGS88443.1 MAG: UDP-N-acetylmuramoyl-L-alanyl-D-glutamate--2,6-diaminopimelate ligase [Fluviicola sp. RIFCSPHIGHO2_12_FULL_43_24]